MRLRFPFVSTCPYFVRTLLAAFVFGGILPAFSQQSVPLAVIPFSQVTIDVSNPRNPHCKSIGDIDGDGFLDVLTASSSNYTEGLFWYRYPSWTKYKISGGTFTTDMQTADVDGDGDLDVIIPKGADLGSAVYWYENPRPAGNPGIDQWREHFIGFAGSHDVAVGDFDNDGRVDVAVRLNGTTLFFRNADSSWTPLSLNTAGAEGLAFGDIDGDSDLDIAVNGTWLENPLPLGNPRTQTWVSRQFAPGWPIHAATVIVDINMDGKKDILLSPSESQNGKISWFESPNPQTDPWTEHIAATGVSYVHEFHVGDFDNDNDFDIAYAEMHQSPNRRVAVLLNTGSALSWTEQVLATTGSHDIRIGDFGNDGDIDIIGANWNDGNTYGAPLMFWENRLNNPQLSLDNWQRKVVDAGRPWQSVFITAADIDRDGKKDIIAGGWWYRNPGTASGTWVRSTIGTPLNNMATVFDFDNNGTPDILGTKGIGATPNAELVWARNDGTGQFTILTNIPNGDGDFLQGVEARRFRNTPGEPFKAALSWHQEGKGIQMLTVPDNPSAGTWGWAQISTTSQDEQISAGDIDRDGNIDLMMGTKWLKNNVGNWSPITLNSNPGHPDRNRMGDLNRDGRLDVVVGYEAINVMGRLAWYEQPLDAQSIWTEHVVSDSVVGPMSVDLADMDRDGDLDVVVGEHNLAAPASARLIVFENVDGVGTVWAKHIVFTGDEHHDGAQVADIDNDGDLDIISLGWGNSNVVLYENLASASILPPAPPLLSAPSNGSTGQTLTPTLQWFGVSTASSYRIQVATDALFSNLISDDSTTTTSIQLSALQHSTTYHWRVRARNTAGVSDWSQVWNFTTLIQVGSAITQHPRDTTVNEGQTAAFFVAATGSPSPNYQWQKNNVDIANATSASYTTPATVFAIDNGATFRCIVSNAGGTVTSNAAILTVNQAGPTISQQPTNQSVQEGAAASFSITATGSPTLAYQWQKNNVDIGGATNVNYTTPATVLADSGATFRCIVSNSIGTVTSNPATLTVTPAISRVNTGVVVLYTFEEGTGTTVNDVSGVGTPLNLTIPTPAAVTWTTGALQINSSTLISNAAAATKVISAVMASNAITVEGWIRPANTTQAGPARIVTISGDANNRDVTLAQGQSGTLPTTVFNTRMRTTTTNDNGEPNTLTPTGTATTALTHVVYTRTAAGLVKMYLNGVESASATVGGNLSNWNTTYRLGLGNEFGADRPWLGAYHLMAIFDRALFAAEVAQNFNAGADVVLTPEPPAITQQPRDTTVNEGQTAAFLVATTGSPTPTYQWQKNNVNIAGATSASYTTPATVFADNGATFRCIVSNAGGTVTSNAAVLTVIQPPPVPQLNFPANGTVGVSIPLTAIWQRSVGAQSYQLQLSTDSSFTGLAFNDSTLTDTTYTLNSLQYSTTYYWRVRARNAGGVSNWSQVRNFITIIQAPVSPLLTSPNNGTVGILPPVSVIWQKSSRAAFYQLQVSTDSLFATFVVNDSTVTDTAYTLNTLPNLTTLYWRVRARNDGGASPYSPVWNFRTLGVSTAVILVSPANGATNVPTNVTFTWQQAQDQTSIFSASRYWFEMVTDTISLANLLRDTTLTDTTKLATGLQNSTIFFWRVKGGNAVGWGSFSSWWRFTTLPPVPQAPLLLLPPNNSVNLATTITARWRSQVAASSYRFQLGTDSSFASGIVVNDSLLVDTSRVVGALGNNTKYFWRVRAENIAGQSNWSAVWNFTTIIQAPATPQLVSPLNGTVGLALPLNVTWQKSLRAAFYQLQVSTDSSFTAIAVNDSTITDSTYTLNSLQYSTTYYWRVRARNAGGVSNWSQAWNFTTINQAPASPLLISPANGMVNVTIPVTAIWQRSIGAAVYQIQLSTDSSFTALVVNDSTLTDTAYALNTLQYSTMYYWRVRARNTGGTSNWSQARNFTTIIQAPTIPLLVSPQNGTIGLWTPIGVVWQKSLRVTFYQLQVSTDSTFIGLVVNDSTLTDTTYVLNSLQYSTTYYWRVRARNIGGISNWPQAWNFRTIIHAPDTPTLLFPANNSLGATTPLSAVWRKSQSAERYHIQLSTDSTFSTTIVNDSTVADTAFTFNTLSPLTTFYWRVRAINAGGSSSYSTGWKFRTIGVPVAVQLLNPANGTVNTPVNIPFTWHQAPGQTGILTTSRYWFEMVTDTISLTNLLRDTTLTDTSKFVTGLQNSMTYFWRVKAGNVVGWASFSSWWKLTTLPAILQAPLLSVPINNSMNLPTTMTARWRSQVGAVSYRFQLGIDSSFTSGIVVNDSSLVDTSRVVGVLGNSIRYFWRVSTNNAAGQSNWSQVWNFTTIIQAPALPQLSSPQNGTIGLAPSLVVNWQRSLRAAFYQLQLASDSSFTTLLVNDSTVTDTAYTLNNLPGLTTLYWRIRARNDGGVSSYSTAWRFRTMGVPAAVQLLTPPNGATNLPINTTFTWQHALDQTSILAASRYWFEMVTDTLSFSNLLRDTTLTDTAKTVAGLQNSSTYFWRLRAGNTVGWSLFSLWWKCSTLPIAPQAPLLLEPPNNSLNLPIVVTARWRDQLVASSYRFQLGIDSSFTSGIVVNDSSIVDTLRVTNGLENGRRYFWRVSADNAGGQGNWSTTWNFTTVVPLPDVVSLLSPLDGGIITTDSVRCSWSSGRPAVEAYWFEISNDSLFSQSSVDSTLADTSFITRGLHPFTRYWWKVRARNAAGWGAFSAVRSFNVTEIMSAIDQTGLPREFELGQNYPNPFNPVTTIRYSLPENTNVTLELFNVFGQRISTLVSAEQGPGTFDVQWNGKNQQGVDVGSGLYLYRLTAVGAGNKQYMNVKKLLLLR